MDKVKGFGEADVFPSDEAKARRIWPEFTRRLGFQLAANHFVRRHRAMGKQLPCHLAIRETELRLIYREEL